jgi:WD40-like Beta Propeller Repeat
LLDLSNGRNDCITTDAAVDQARWSRDGKWIYFGSNRTGRFEVWKMPADGDPAVRMTTGGGIAGIEGRDGFLHYAKALVSPTSIWRVPVAGGGKETLVLDGLSYSSNFAVGERGLYFMFGGACRRTSRRQSRPPARRTNLPP